MKWKDFTLKAMQEKRPDLMQSEYHRVVDGTWGTVSTRQRLDQYELLGTRLLHVQLFEILEWKLGIHHLAVVELSEAISHDLARRFGEFLEPITSAVEMGLDVEQLGKRMLGFMYSQYSRTITNDLMSELCKRMVLPHQINFDTALKINHHPAVDILRIDGQAFGEVRYLYQISDVGADNIIGVDRDQVESQFLMKKFGKDIRRLSCIPRYRRHHASERWAVWLFPNDFANYWQLPDQDVMDLMDDTDKNRRDRRILRRIGEQVLTAEYLRYLILDSQHHLQYDELTSTLAMKLVMPDYIQYPEDRNQFLRQFVGYWRVTKHETLPEIDDELRPQRVISQPVISNKLSEPFNVSVNKVTTVNEIALNHSQVDADQLAENFEQVAQGQYPDEMRIDVKEDFPLLLQSLTSLGEVESVEWFAHQPQPEDIYSLKNVLEWMRDKFDVDIHLVGPHIPQAVQLEKTKKKKLVMAYASLSNHGVNLEHTDAYISMKSFFQVNYKYQTIIFQSPDEAELAFAKGINNQNPKMVITCCTFAHPLAQQLFAQKRGLAKQVRLRHQTMEYREADRLEDAKKHSNVQSSCLKAKRLSKPSKLTTRDYLKQRISESSDVQVKNRFNEWLKYEPDTIQANITVVRQNYFVLYFKSRKVVILDSLTPNNAYFVFYDKSVKEVVSQVRHMGSKAAVLRYSSMRKRGYHDTEPIKQRVRRIFARQI